jgi:hypothetical protein
MSVRIAIWLFGAACVLGFFMYANGIPEIQPNPHDTFKEVSKNFQSHSEDASVQLRPRAYGETGLPPIGTDETGAALDSSLRSE